MTYDPTLEPGDPGYVPPDVDSTILLFIAGGSAGLGDPNCTPVSWISDHLREMQVTPRGRALVKERLAHFAEKGWVEQLTNRGWRFTEAGRRYMADEHQCDWLIQP